MTPRPPLLRHAVHSRWQPEGRHRRLPRAGRPREPGERALAIRELLRRFLDVCNAVAYAHSRGVLHRDLKPGNVMVGKYGETLLVDWGLAKAVGRTETTPPSEERPLEPRTSGGSTETLPGSAVGTPSYMSPEQAAGDLDRLGTLSDVYGLGATLYCLLTGRAPFEGTDLGVVLHSVRNGEFPRPRVHDPSIDRALEAVCLKAMSLKPEDRYRSPIALAGDVERWMADEPVAALPEGRGRRLARWARRNRPWVRAGVAALLLVAIAAIASAFAINAARGKATAALVSERAAKAEAEENFQTARRAVRDYLTTVSENTLLNRQDRADLRALRKELLEGA